MARRHPHPGPSAKRSARALVALALGTALTGALGAAWHGAAARAGQPQDGAPDSVSRALCERIAQDIAAAPENVPWQPTYFGATPAKGVFARLHDASVGTVFMAAVRIDTTNVGTLPNGALAPTKRNAIVPVFVLGAPTAVAETAQDGETFKLAAGFGGFELSNTFAGDGKTVISTISFRLGGDAGREGYEARFTSHSVVQQPARRHGDRTRVLDVDAMLWRIDGATAGTIREMIAAEGMLAPGPGEAAELAPVGIVLMPPDFTAAECTTAPAPAMAAGPAAAASDEALPEAAPAAVPPEAAPASAPLPRTRPAAMARLWSAGSAPERTEETEDGAARPADGAEAADGAAGAGGRPEDGAIAEDDAAQGDGTIEEDGAERADRDADNDDAAKAERDGGADGAPEDDDSAVPEPEAFVTFAKVTITPRPAADKAGLMVIVAPAAFAPRLDGFKVSLESAGARVEGNVALDDASRRLLAGQGRSMPLHFLRVLGQDGAPLEIAAGTTAPRLRLTAPDGTSIEQQGERSAPDGAAFFTYVLGTADMCALGVHSGPACPAPPALADADRAGAPADRAAAGDGKAEAEAGAEGDAGAGAGADRGAGAKRGAGAGPDAGADPNRDADTDGAAQADGDGDGAETGTGPGDAETTGGPETGKPGAGPPEPEEPEVPEPAFARLELEVDVVIRGLPSQRDYGLYARTCTFSLAADLEDGAQSFEMTRQAVPDAPGQVIFTLSRETVGDDQLWRTMTEEAPDTLSLTAGGERCAVAGSQIAIAAPAPDPGRADVLTAQASAPPYGPLVTIVFAYGDLKSGGVTALEGMSERQRARDMERLVLLFTKNVWEVFLDNRVTPRWAEISGIDIMALTQDDLSRAEVTQIYPPHDGAQYKRAVDLGVAMAGDADEIVLRSYERGQPSLLKMVEAIGGERIRGEGIRYRPATGDAGEVLPDVVFLVRMEPTFEDACTWEPGDAKTGIWAREAIGDRDVRGIRVPGRGLRVIEIVAVGESADEFYLRAEAAGEALYKCPDTVDRGLSYVEASLITSLSDRFTVAGWDSFKADLTAQLDNLMRNYR